MNKTLFLLDGHALIYRAHFAFAARPIINTKGRDTSCIYGFTNTLLHLLKKNKPSHIASSFDTRTTFRHALYEPYKANREKQPESITEGLGWVRAILDALGIPIYEKEGYEADDVIGTIAQQAVKRGCAVYVVSTDKDFGQIISEKIRLYKPGRAGKEDETVGLEHLNDAFGVRRPAQVADKLALQGDSVDNIPGVPGIGPKTAAKLLEEHSTLEELLKQSATLKKRLRACIENHREELLLYKKLATIDTAVPVVWDEEASKIKAYRKERLQKLFKELEFNRLAQRFAEEHQEMGFRAEAGNKEARNE